MTSLPELPLLHNGDSYLLHLDLLSERVLKLETILRFLGNSNSRPEYLEWNDLDQTTKRRIVEHINSRYPKATIKV